MTKAVTFQTSPTAKALADACLAVARANHYMVNLHSQTLSIGEADYTDAKRLLVWWQNGDAPSKRNQTLYGHALEVLATGAKRAESHMENDTFYAVRREERNDGPHFCVAHSFDDHGKQALQSEVWHTHEPAALRDALGRAAMVSMGLGKSTGVTVKYHDGKEWTVRTTQEKP